jgi:hypothetical protein
MRKNSKKYTGYDEDYEDEWTSRSAASKYFERRKNKRLINAMRSRNVTDILELEDDEDDE